MASSIKELQKYLDTFIDHIYQVVLKNVKACLTW